MLLRFELRRSGRVDPGRKTHVTDGHEVQMPGGSFDYPTGVPAEPRTRRWRRSLKELLPGPIRRRVRHLSATVNPDPIIVLGTQKSGTTVIANLLAIAARESLTSDIFYRYPEPLELWLLTGRLDFKTFVQRYRADFANRIIKEPSLTFMYPGLKAVFPEAHYVYVLRDPRDTIRSVLDRLKLPGDKRALEPECVRHLEPYIGWGLILAGVGLPPGETYIDRLAIRWRTAAELLLREGERFIVVRYEDFLQEKSGTIHRLAEQLLLPIHNDIRDHVDVQFQPAGNSRVGWEPFFGGENLARIERICRDMMASLGYR